MPYTKLDFETQLLKLPIRDFIPTQAVQAVRWTQSINDHVNSITIGFKDYFNSWYLQTPFVSICYPEIEQQLTPFGLGADYTIQGEPGTLPGVDYSVFTTEIDDEQKFTLVTNEVMNIVNRGALPFFNRFNQLTAVADFLSDKTPEDIARYIPGVVLFVRAALIFRATNHPVYKRRLMQFHHLLRQYVQSRPKHKSTLDVFEQIFAADLKSLS